MGISKTRTPAGCLLKDAVRIDQDKILNPEYLTRSVDITPDAPVLVILVAGKGTRFGTEPKCIQPVHGIPLARHSIDAFRRFTDSPVIAIVGYRYEDVSGKLGDDIIRVLSDNPAGGTAFAAYEAFCIPDLIERNPLLVITMGDRIVPSSIFRRLSVIHSEGAKEADLTFLTAWYEPPKNSGKGRVLRDETGKVIRIVEERDIVREENDLVRQSLLNITEGNCPLYTIRAATLYKHLVNLNNNNAQSQYYLTDIIQSISETGGDIRTLSTYVSDHEYDLLTSDVTQPMDLAMLEGILASNVDLLLPEERD